MQQMQTFARDDIVPSWFANAIGRALSVMTDNLTVQITSPTQISIPASANDGGVVATIGGKWRYVESTVGPIAHPGGPAGIYPMFITSADNDIVSTPNPYTDDTNYAFGLQILAAGATPSTALYRNIGSVIWSGSKILAVRQTIGRPVDVGWEPGDLKLSLRSDTEYGWVAADGSSYSRVACADMRAGLGSLAGNGDGSTTFTVPNFGSRALVVAGTGAALTERDLGAMFGEETIKLSGAQSGVNGNGATRGGTTAESGTEASIPVFGFSNNIENASVQGADQNVTAWSYYNADVGFMGIYYGAGMYLSLGSIGVAEGAVDIPALTASAQALADRQADATHDNTQASVAVNALIKV